MFSGPSFERLHLNPNKNGLPNEVVFHQRGWGNRWSFAIVGCINV